MEGHSAESRSKGNKTNGGGIRTKPEDCLAGIGPSIEMDCFEVGRRLRSQFAESFGNQPQIMRPLGKGKYAVDLWEVNKLMLMDAGVPENILRSADFAQNVMKNCSFHIEGTGA